MDTQEISQALRVHRLLALDSCILIYALEWHPEFGAAARHMLESVQAGSNRAVVSTLALMEALVGPYRRADARQAEYYFAVLRQMPNFSWAPLTFDIADLAAELRAEFRVSTPDAIHLATAVESGATLFVTDDRHLPPIPGLRYLVLRGT